MNGTFRLQKMMSEKTTKEVTRLLSTFKCTAEPELERYLKDVARGHESKDISRTFIVIHDDIVIGFFTLATKCLAVGKRESVIRNIGNDFYSSMNINDGVAQSYIIAQLAKADDAGKGYGRQMIFNALKLLGGIKRYVGCRLVRLDCRDKLVQYYSDAGFVRIGKNCDSTLNQMAILI